jgi:hypothetical protein
MLNTIVGAGAVGTGAGAASRYGSGSGSDQKMRLLAAPAPKHCFLEHIFNKKMSEKSWAKTYLGQDPDVFVSRILIRSKIVRIRNTV